MEYHDDFRKKELTSAIILRCWTEQTSQDPLDQFPSILNSQTFSSVFWAKNTSNSSAVFGWNMLYPLLGRFTLKSKSLIWSLLPLKTCHLLCAVILYTNKKAHNYQYNLSYYNYKILLKKKRKIKRNFLSISIKDKIGNKEIYNNSFTLVNQLSLNPLLEKLNTILTLFSNFNSK